ncbi:MAG: DNA polymerase III subunit delta [Dehalococcoidales bacterium]|nr:MAG: DNA polymerase III subunit delta [Dehalococcoidales bacterium]
MLYILTGPDDYSLGQSLEKLKGSIGDPEALAVNTTVLEGQQVTIDQLRSVCEAAPFLAEKRLVIVKGLLQRFQPPGRQGRQGRGRKTSIQPDGYEALASYINTVPDSTILVLVEDEIKGTNPLFRTLSNKAKVHSFPLLRDGKLKQWVQGRVKEEDGSITPQAVELLARLVGSNLWVMSSEIDKLLLFTSGRHIEEEDIKQVVGYTQQTSVFAMVDAIVESRIKVAEQLLQELLQQGASSSYLMVMLARQLRLIVRTKDIQTARMSPNELRNRLNLTSEFVARKTLEQARRYSLPRLKQVYQQLLETDLAIKTGKYEPELALNILVAELCQRPVH